VLPGKFYLADAGYWCSDYLLVPYRGVRYHFRESHRAQERPATPKELFNLRHSQLRIVIEKVFGILKWKNKIHFTAPNFRNLYKQAEIILATTVVHNFRLHHGADLDDEHNDIEALLPDSSTLDRPMAVYNNSQSVSGATESRRRMERFRDNIAQAMWDDYLDYLNHR